MKTLTPKEAQELLKRFRSGECSEKELEIINTWYESIAENNEMPLLNQEIDLGEVKSSMFSEINKRIDEVEETSDKVKTLYWNYLVKVAAVVILIVGSVFTIYKINQSNSSVQTNTIALQVIEKKITPSDKIILSDGTIVWLKAGSNLEYPKEFTGKTREVTLTGEAFFEVHRDVKRPFIIHSGAIDTKVLGTSFNIKAYENDPQAEITVVTGKVSVALGKGKSSKFKEVILQPNQKVTYLKEFNKLVRLEERNALKYKIVAQNELVFDEAYMKDILSAISLAYKVEIVLENEKIENCIITADLTNQSLEATLKILTRSIGAKFTTQENKILISGKGCESY